MDLDNGYRIRTRRSSISSENGAPDVATKRLRKKYVLSDDDDTTAADDKDVENTEDAAIDTSQINGEKSAPDCRQLDKIARFKEETVRPVEAAVSKTDEQYEAGGLTGEALERFGSRNASKFWFLGKYRKDSSGRSSSSPNFDRRTLFLPAEFVKGLTGGQRQWWEFKAKNMDKVLLFKMGKFYEMFEMDAHVGAQDLDLQYMKGEQPHCGFPEKNYFENVAKLVRKGHRVLVVEQTETPEQLEERKRRTGSKDKVVRREICAVITKGTMVDSDMISDNAEPAFLLALTEREDDAGGSVIGLCVVDTSRALFMLGQVDDDAARTKLRCVLTELRPVEIVQPIGLLTDATLKALKEHTRKPLITQLVPSKEFWDAKQTIKEISSIFGNSDSFPPVIQRVAESDAPVLSAFGGCISYLRQALLDRQLLQLGRFESLPGSDLSLGHSGTCRDEPGSDLPLEQSESLREVYAAEKHMILDSAALENLEILENSSNGSVSGTLLSLLDHCITPFGRRLLKQWIVRPLHDIDSIVQRQKVIVDMQDLAENAVSEFRREPCFCSAVASDPDPLQDFCIADLTAVPGINGFPCRNASTVTVNDFIYSGIVSGTNTTNINRSGATFGTVLRFPGLNTQGLSIARLDFLPEGIIAPHTHPRASEMVYVEEGSIYAAIVTADNRLYARVMTRGEVMIIPRGLIHWQMNVGTTNAKVIAMLNSQLPGIQFIARSLFGSQPPIPYDALEKTFFVDQTIDQIRSNFV